MAGVLGAFPARIRRAIVERLADGLAGRAMVARTAGNVRLESARRSDVRWLPLPMVAAGAALPDSLAARDACHTA